MIDLAAIIRGLCDKQSEAKCQAECGDNLDWACARCEKKKVADLHEYTHKMLKIRHLKLAGYPFRANDLALEEWMDLGVLEDAFKGLKWQTKTP